LVDLLTTDPLAKELNLDEKKREALKVDAKKIDEELEKQIAKLRAEARKKIVGKLSLKQQKQLKDLLGTSFLFQKSDRKKRTKKQAKNRQWKGKK